MPVYKRMLKTSRRDEMENKDILNGTNMQRKRVLDTCSRGVGRDV